MPVPKLTLKSLEKKINRQGEIIADLIKALKPSHPIIGGAQRGKWTRYEEELRGKPNTPPSF